MSKGWQAEGPHIFVWFEFHPGLVEGLKVAIPRSSRRWVPGRRGWLIDREYWRLAVSVFRHWGVLFDDQTDAGPRQPDASDADAAAWAALHLRPGAPPEMVAAAYRVLAKLHHPDHGGDTEAMKAINLAYERLAKPR